MTQRERSLILDWLTNHRKLILASYDDNQKAVFERDLKIIETFLSFIGMPVGYNRLTARYYYENILQKVTQDEISTSSAS